MTLIEKLKARARTHPQRIVLPEGEDPRIVAAAAAITREGYAKITLLGRKAIIESVAANLRVPLTNITIIDPAASPRLAAYAQIYYERRRARGISLEESSETARRPLYFAALAVSAGDADGTVGGAANTTGETVRAALHAIGLAPDARLVSSFFVMVIPERPGLNLEAAGALLFADCAVIPDPNPEELAEIARATAENARALFDVEPRVAMLSFSTKGSASHPHVEKVREALRILKARAPEIAADGELQGDAALVPGWEIRKPLVLRWLDARTCSSFPISTPAISPISLWSVWLARTPSGRSCRDLRSPRTISRAAARPKM